MVEQIKKTWDLIFTIIAETIGAIRLLCIIFAFSIAGLIGSLLTLAVSPVGWIIIIILLLKQC